MRGHEQRNLVERLTWDGVHARLAQGAAAILPIGAGAKQHGFHLPMNTDQITAEHLAARLADEMDALIWPTVTYGHYPAFVEYAGSISLSASTFEKMIEEIVMALICHDASHILVLDTGISTVPAIARALGRVANERVLHLPVHRGEIYRHEVARLSNQPYGTHADEIETALMLSLKPDVVDMARAEASPLSSQDAQGLLTPFDSTSGAYSRSGSFGDPTLATREQGETLLAAIVEDLVTQIAAFKASSDLGQPR